MARYFGKSGFSWHGDPYAADRRELAWRAVVVPLVVLAIFWLGVLTGMLGR